MGREIRVCVCVCVCVYIYIYIYIYISIDMKTAETFIPQSAIRQVYSLFQSELSSASYSKLQYLLFFSKVIQWLLRHSPSSSRLFYLFLSNVF